MTHRWNQDIHIDESIARKAIESQHPIIVESISKLDEGWDNIAYLINNQLIFRFPRRQLGLEYMENEIIALPHIVKHVSFPLSAPLYIGKPSAIYPHPFAGYPMLPGVEVAQASQHLIDDPNTAITLAQWLKELHQVPLDQHVVSQFTGGSDWRLDFAVRGTRFKKHLSQYQPHFETAGFPAASLLDHCVMLESWTFPSQPRAFIHADLYERHILVNPTTLTLTGIIDWGDVQIGHPAIDLEAGFIFTPDVFQLFLKSYGNIDHGMMQVLLFNAFFGATSFLPYAFERNTPYMKHWATLTLTRVLQELEMFLRK